MATPADRSAGAVRIVVVGAGSIGTRHRQILDDLPEVEVTVVPGRPERVAALREQGVRARASVLEALDDGADGVIVATDSGRHSADAILALEHGAHVLVEKPLATSVDTARAIVDAADRAGRGAHVASCLRFDPGLRWIASRVGEIGPLVFADAECTSWLPDWRPGRSHLDGYAARAGEGGVLFDLIHEIDACGWLVGPLAVRGAALFNHGELGLPAEVEETAVILAVGDAAAPVTIRLSFASRSSRRVLRLVGERGALEWDYNERRASLTSTSGDDDVSWGGADEMYRAQIDAWLAFLRGGDGADLAGAASGVEAVEVCEAARHAAHDRVGSR